MNCKLLYMHSNMIFLWCLRTIIISYRNFTFVDSKLSRKVIIHLKKKQWDLHKHWGLRPNDVINIYKLGILNMSLGQESAGMRQCVC